MYDDKAERRDGHAANFVKYMAVPVYLRDRDSAEYGFAVITWGTLYGALYDAALKAIEEGRHVRRQQRNA